MSTSILLVRCPGWVLHLLPTVHKVLGHSWELIELNSCFGLGTLDESGMEGCHRILRNVRTNLSRKQSQQANMTDTIRRLWLSSDPAINQERQKGLPWCKKCKVRGHSGRYCRANKKDDSSDTFALLLDRWLRVRLLWWIKPYVSFIFNIFLHSNYFLYTFV